VHDFLIDGDPVEVARSLEDAASDPDRLAAAVYRTSAIWRREVDARGRRHLLAVDAVRWGATGLAEALAADGDDDWAVRWSTGGDVDDRLRFAFPCGRVDAVCPVDVAGRPAIVTARTGHYDGDCNRFGTHDCGESSLGLWDVTTGTLLGVIPDAGGTAELGTHLATQTVDGRPIAVVADSREPVRVWDLATGREATRPLVGHTDGVTGVAATTVDGVPVAATVSLDGTLRRWRLADGQPFGAPIEIGDRLYEVTIAHLDGRPVAVVAGRDTGIGIHDLGTGEPVRRWDVSASAVNSMLTTSVEGRLVLVAARLDGTVERWALDDAAPLGPPIAAGSPIEVRWPFVGGMAVVAVSGQPMLVVALDHAVHLFDPVSGRPAGPPLRGLTGHASVAPAAADGQVVVASATDQAVGIWSLDRSPDGPGAPMRGHTSPIRGVAAVIAPAGSAPPAGSPDQVTRTSGNAGGTAVTGAWDGVRLWHLVDGACVHGGTAARGADGGAGGGEGGKAALLPGRPINAVATARLAGRAVALAGGGNLHTVTDEHVYRLALPNGAPVGQPIHAGHRGEIHAVATAEVDGRPVAVTGGADGTVRLWDVATGAELDNQPAQYPTSGMAIGTVDGRPVAAVSRYFEPLLLWDLASRETLPTEAFGMRIYSHVVVGLVEVDGRSILVTVANHETVRGWDVLGGEEAGVGSGIGDAPQVTAVAVGVRSGRPVAVVGRADATVHLLDLRSWTAAAPAFTLPRPAGALSLLPDGNLLAGFGVDVTLLRPPF
jgi:WD40 repeat protein